MPLKEENATNKRLAIIWIRNMNTERTIPTLLNQIREEVLPYIAHPSELQTAEGLQHLRSRLHSLHYYCIRTQASDAVCNRVEVPPFNECGFLAAHRRK